MKTLREEEEEEDGGGENEAAENCENRRTRERE